MSTQTLVNPFTDTVPVRAEVAEGMILVYPKDTTKPPHRIRLTVPSGESVKVWVEEGAVHLKRMKANDKPKPTVRCIRVHRDQFLETLYGLRTFLHVPTSEGYREDEVEVQEVDDTGTATGNAYRVRSEHTVHIGDVTVYSVNQVLAYIYVEALTPTKAATGLLFTLFNRYDLKYLYGQKDAVAGRTVRVYSQDPDATRKSRSGRLRLRSVSPIRL